MALVVHLPWSGGSPGKSTPRSRNAPGFLTQEMTFVNCGLRLWSVFSESRTYLPAQVDLPHLCCEKRYVLRIHSLCFSDLGKVFHDETDVSHCHLSDTEPQAVIERETGLGDAVIHTSNYRVREAEAQVGKCLGRGCKIAQGEVQMRTEQCCPALPRDSCFAESQKLPCPCRPGSWAPQEKRHSALHVSKHPFVLRCHWNAAESRGCRWMAGAGRTLSWIIRSSR